MKNLLLRSHCVLFLILLIGQGVTANDEIPTKPNVLLILADDLGWSDTTLFGTTRFYKTPNIERLAARGMTFSRAYSSSPLCSPTRASILTGLSPARTGITAPNCHLPKVILKATSGSQAAPNRKATLPESVTRLDPKYYTLAEMFKDNGYATGHFGKWHLGPAPYSPLEHGFDIDVPHWPGPGPAGSYVAPWKFPDFDPNTPSEHIEDRMAAEAAAFMEKHQNEPFFLNYWMFSVHAPFDAKQKLIDQYKQSVNPNDPQRSPTYAAMIESMDDAVGTLLDTLDRLKIADHTIIIFASDNGGNMYNEVDGTTATSNSPLRGGKATMYEGGIRGPAVIVRPGTVQAGSRSEEIIQSSDFYPTLLEMLSIKSDVDQSFDGISVVPALNGHSLNRKAIFTYFPHNPAVPDWLPPAVSVHQGDWKLIRIFFGGESGAHRWKLFNLKEDPGEKNDLSADYPERVKELDALIEQFLVNTDAVQPTPNPKFDPSKYRPELEGKANLKGSKNAPEKTEQDAQNSDQLLLSTSTAKVGIDRTRGAAITLLASAKYPQNMVNLADPGRLIQQSYYAGKSRDRTEEGQSKSWSPWSWNPIQGGGVESWASVTDFQKTDNGKMLYAETIPNLWDMPNEPAAARMRQWTSFEPGIPDVVVVKCEVICSRDTEDPWGPAMTRSQEVPACYFTRNFAQMKSYLGDGKWREERQKPGPPWGKTNPPRKAMAFFESGGQGVAVFSPCATGHFNFGPHAGGLTDDPLAGPCMHVAPIDRVKLGPDSTYRYRYWLIVGNEANIASRLDVLWEKYASERSELTTVRSAG